jgi:hypothetical protein
MKGGENMANEMIKETIKASGFYFWEVAQEMKLSDGNFSRKLRKEFTDDQKKEVMDIIADLKAKKGA